MYSLNIADYTTVKISNFPFKKSRSTGLIFDHVRNLWFKHNLKVFRPIDLEFYTKNNRRTNITNLNTFVIAKMTANVRENKHLPVIDIKNTQVKQKLLDKAYGTVNKSFKITTPKAITDQILLDAVEKYRKEVCDFTDHVDLDYMRLGLNIIIVKKLYKKTHSIKKFYDKCAPDFVQVPSTLVYKIGGTIFYNHYWKALLHSEIIICDNKFYNFIDNHKAFGYKINDKFYEDKEQWQKYHQMHDVTNVTINSNIGKYKHQIRDKKAQKNQLFKDMIFDVETLFNTIDTDEIREYYKDNVHEFYDVSNDEELKNKLADPNTVTIEKVIDSIEVVKNDNHYFNVSDQFGGRFHSAFTNMKSCIRKFVKYEGSRYVNVDISNSQMVFLATIIENPDKAAGLMNNVKWNIAQGTSLKDVIAVIKGVKNNLNQNNDLDLFIEKTKEGVIYEYISDYLKCDRSQAKIDLIKVIFSNDIQYKKIKAKIGKLFPSLITLANILNIVDGTHYLPKICQKFESEIFINRITGAFFKVKAYPAVTIHDSIMVHPNDLNKFKDVYNQIFNEIGLDPFKLKEEHYTLDRG